MVIGVAGEFAVHTRAGKVETDMRIVSRSLMALADERAGDANKKAGEANERASQNEKAAASLRAETERERLARVKIEERLAPRNLTTEQSNRITRRLRRFSGQHLEVIRYAPSREATSFSEQIERATTNAGWIVTTPHVLLGAEMEPVIFVFFANADVDKPPPAGPALVSILRAEGITVRYLRLGGFVPEDLQRGSVGLFVGPKP